MTGSSGNDTLTLDFSAGNFATYYSGGITETASTIATTALLEISDMVAVMPKSLAGHYSRLGVLKVLPLALPIHVPPIYLITRTDRTPSPASTQFIKAIYAASPRI